MLAFESAPDPIIRVAVAHVFHVSHLYNTYDYLMGRFVFSIVENVRGAKIRSSSKQNGSRCGHVAKWVYSQL